MSFGPQRWLLLFLILSLHATLAYSKERFDTALKQRPFDPETSSSDYGLNLDGFAVNKDIVRPGQTLAGILKQYDVPYRIIKDAMRKSKEVFDVRKLRSGNAYSIIIKSGQDKTVRYFIYSRTLLDYVVFRLFDPVGVYTGTKPVEVRARVVSARIESTLWEAFDKRNLNHEVVDQLSGIYARTIDFRRLQKGDEVKLIFDETFSEGKPAGIIEIKAARFNHKWEAFYAFCFEQDGIGRYYDENGNCLEKAFLRAPLKSARITSAFSRKRFHPVLKKYKRHLGIDFGAPPGTPVMTVGDGVILKTGHSRSKGKFIEVKHNGMYRTQYLHLSGFADGTQPGARIKQGDIIGYVGSTGLTTGSNLDFRFYKNGKPVDYTKVELPAGASVKNKYIHLFNQQITKLKMQLDANTESIARIQNTFDSPGS